MRPNVILHHYVMTVEAEPVAAASIQGLDDYELASRGGRYQVAAVTIRHRVKYEWATRRRGRAKAEIYRRCEFMALDEEPVCIPTVALHACDRLMSRIRSRFDPYTEVQEAVADVVRLSARDALRGGWEAAEVAVEVETTTLISYDWVRWWRWRVPCALPAGGGGKDRHPIEALKMEVIAEGTCAGAGGGCAVCLEDFVAGAQVERLPCGHRFHGECVLPWLDREGSCPLCRSECRIK